MIEEGDQECVALDGGDIEVVDEFLYRLQTWEGWT